MSASIHIIQLDLPAKTVAHYNDKRGFGLINISHHPNMQLFITLTAIFLYSASFIVLLRQIRSRKRPAPWLFEALLGLSIIVHIFSLSYNVFPNQTLHLGFFRVSSLIFCVISIIAFISILRKLPIENLLVILFPLTILGIGVGQWVANPADKIIEDSGLIVHIILSILAYSIITIASLQALALAAQEDLFKRHAFKGLFEYLPPLQTMEKLLFEMVWLGFILLTISIISGFVFLDNMFAQHLAHKTLFSILAWVIFAILLYGRHARGWRGKAAASWTIFGFSLLMLGYFGSKFVLEIILQRA